MKSSSAKEVGTGIGFGALSGISWGLDAVLIGVCLSMAVFVDVKLIFLAPLVCAFIHDTFSTLWAMIYTIATGRFKDFIAAFTKRSGWFIMLAAICGGPIAMTGYYLAIQYIGAGYAATITAIFPAISGLLSYLILKEKLSKLGWLGLTLCIAATAFLGITTENASENMNVPLGILFSLMAALGWALESVICAYGMKEDVLPETAFQVRQFVSAVVFAVIIIPAIGGYELAFEVFKHFNVWGLLIVTALAGTISYFAYYKAIDRIGAIRTVGLNITYSVWAIIFGLFFGSAVSWQLAVACVVILIGAMLTVGDPKQLIGSKEKSC